MPCMQREIPGKIVDSHDEQTDQNSIEDLVTRLRRGDADAWEVVVTRFANLVRAATRKYRLSEADSEDVFQTVWLKLYEHLDNIREPKALPGWIAVTAAHECGRVVSQGKRTVLMDPLGSCQIDQAAVDVLSRPAAPGDLEERLVREECRLAIRAGLAQLPVHQQQLLVLLVQDPPLSYAEIGARLGMPVGSIGPTRARCLSKLRNTPVVIQEFGQSETSAA